MCDYHGENVFSSLSGPALKRITTVQRGSWKWQDAFEISTYKPRVLKNGKLVWRSVSGSGKMSEPQLRRHGLSNYKHGSAHNKSVPACVRLAMGWL